MGSAKRLPKETRARSRGACFDLRQYLVPAGCGAMAEQGVRREFFNRPESIVRVPLRVKQAKDIRLPVAAGGLFQPACRLGNLLRGQVADLTGTAARGGNGRHRIFVTILSKPNGQNYGQLPGVQLSGVLPGVGPR